MRRVLIAAILATLCAAAPAHAQQVLTVGQTAHPLLFFMESSTTPGTGVTGLAATVSVHLSKDGAAGVVPSGAISEVDATNHPGLYKVAGNATDEGTDGTLWLTATAAGCFAANVRYVIEDVNAYDALRGGMTQIPSTGTIITEGTGANQLSTTSGQVLVQAGVGAGQLDFTSGVAKSNLTLILGTAVSTPATAGILDINVKNENNVAATAITTIKAVQGLTTADTIATYTGNTPQTGDSYAIVNNATYGNAQLVRSTTPANTLSVDTSHLVGANGVTGNVSGSVGSVTGAVGSLADAGASLTALGDTRIVNLDAGVKSIRVGTAQAGAASTITLDAGASATNSIYVGQTIALTGGTGAGQSRVVITYGGSTKVATVDHVWQTNPDSTSVFALRGSDTPATDSSLDITANGVSGNVTGSVASVSGAVGSVTGAVGSVAGNVGGNVVGSVASVTGAVGSVTGAVTVGTNNDKTGYSLTSAEETAIANALLNSYFETTGTSISVKSGLEMMFAVLCGCSDGGGTTTLDFFAPDFVFGSGGTKRVTTTLQDTTTYNRKAVTRNP